MQVELNVWLHVQSTFTRYVRDFCISSAKLKCGVRYRRRVSEPKKRNDTQKFNTGAARSWKRIVWNFALGTRSEHIFCRDSLSGLYELWLWRRNTGCSMFVRCMTFYRNSVRRAECMNRAYTAVKSVWHFFSPPIDVSIMSCCYCCNCCKGGVCTSSSIQNILNFESNTGNMLAAFWA